ncbi:hypothetical protein UPYG_G00341350 [Umbra pygmaea]|uniref:Regulation of nuclear pre-mRNA domain-containing protein 2 n=1 Tax=Umbra pygmaea TaxID=75934 RepID=A0ABD0WIW0_UMBPY
MHQNVGCDLPTDFNEEEGIACTLHLRARSKRSSYFELACEPGRQFTTVSWKMAAGSGASSGHCRGSPTALESMLDRKFQGVSNTMDSIQGLSNWCLENKKYHSLIVRYWMKWLKRSGASHRLNLFYLANDVIQNCKRKNAIVYRTAYAEVLPEAFQLVNVAADPKVLKSVDRILTIWEERSVYTDELIAELRASLVKEESPVALETTKVSAPVNTKAALQSKIVAEFVPQAFIEHLSSYHRTFEEVELKEKQLAAMRVDVCSTENLKRLKDKAGGKKHCKDFEEGSAKLKEFVAFFERQLRGGPPLLDALGNADIFYEMQYKEVKIVANAYKTFANRVSHLKRKLDSLKATLPDLDESPIPSPSMDAPSPTGTESPYHPLANPDSDLDDLVMENEADITLAEAPSPLSSPGGSPKPVFTIGESDNRDVEDMELSDEEEVPSASIIVEERVEDPVPSPVHSPEHVVTQPPLYTEAKQVLQAPLSPVLFAPAMPTTDLSSSFANVDMGKISSILSSITSVIKKPAGSPGGPLLSPSSPTNTIPPAPVVPQVPNPLASILSKVDFTPEALLSALAKTQGVAKTQLGLSTHLNSPTGNFSSNSPSTGKLPPSASTPTAPSEDSPHICPVLELTPSAPALGNASLFSQAASIPQATPPLAIGPLGGLVKEQEKTKEAESSISSLESKIHSFLQGNPGFNAFNLGLTSEVIQAGTSGLSPSVGTETQEGTPVRDETGGGTPTLDEIMDMPGTAAEPFLNMQAQLSSEGVSKQPDGSLSQPLPTYHNQAWQDPNTTHVHLGQHPGTLNGQMFHQLPHRGNEELHSTPSSISESGLTNYQQHVAPQGSAPTLGNRLATYQQEQVPAGPRPSGSDGGWYGNPFPEGQATHASNHSMAATGGSNNVMSGQYDYQEGRTQPYQTMDAHTRPSQQGATSSFLKSPLPPIPKLPPPPFPGLAGPLQNYQAPATSVVTVPVEPPVPNTEMEEDRAGISALGGPVVVSDHQHKSSLHPTGHPYHPNDFHNHPGNLDHQAEDPRQYPDVAYRPDDFHLHPEEPHRYPGEAHHHPGEAHHHPGEAHHHPGEAHHHPGEAHHHPGEAHHHPGEAHHHPGEAHRDLRHQPDDWYYPSDDFHHLPVEDPHYPYRVREHLTPPLSPSEDPYYYDYPPCSPSPPHGHRRPPPTHMDPHHQGHRPMLPRLPHRAHHPHPRGMPRGLLRPPLRGPMPRGKRPGPPFGGFPRGGGQGGPFFPPKRPYVPPRF